MDDDGSKQKNISGLSFKDLTLLDKSQNNREEFLFVNEEINDGSWISVLRKNWKTYINKQRERKSFVSFLISWIEYNISRFRVIWILFSVFFDIFQNFINVFKDKVIKRMFWGRGNFLRSALQGVMTFIVFILVISYIYRRPVVIEASNDQLSYVGVSQEDTIVMNATLNTLVPKDRVNRTIEDYTVKSGDTISSIAKNFGIKNETVLWANNLSSTSLIKPGQTLKIPLADGVLITVGSGDTLASLAKKYTANEQAIADFNLLDYPFTLTKGQQLFIPDGTMTESTIASKPTTTKTSTPSSYVSNQYTGATSISGGDSKVGKFLSWPVAGGKGRITQYFHSYHLGIDIADASLPNMVAAASGTVLFAGCFGTCPPLGSTYGGTNYAWSIQIDHGNGYTTWYAHLKNIYVRVGQKVTRGQVIGQMGSTGNSTGPHCHFEVRKGSAWGTEVNPIYYLNY